MPGHVKLGKAGEPDPDPCPYLVLTPEMKRDDANKPYDAKKSYWCPDGKHGFMECILEGVDGGKATVMCGHEVSLKYKKIHYDTFIAVGNLMIKQARMIAKNYKEK